MTTLQKIIEEIDDEELKFIAILRQGMDAGLKPGKVYKVPVKES